jgi:hypothetical protein
MADVIITLNVDTSEISVHNIDSCSNFGQEPGISNENFSTAANVGDTVIWQGISSSAPETDIVNIIKINHYSGNNVFNQPKLIGNGLRPEKVSGIVQKDTGGGTEEYTIFFNVFNGVNKRPGIFSIDPKLAINP